jgi:hypothetical protein
MQENVAIVRDLVSNWQRGNSPAVKAALDPRVEGHVAGEAASHVGIHAVLALLEGWKDAFGDFRAGRVEFVPAGDTVVVHCRFRRRPGARGAAVLIDETQIYRVLNRRVVAVHEYRTGANGRQGRQPVGARGS